MDSWARRSSRARSSLEYSPPENSPSEDSPDSTATGLGRGSDIAVRLRRRHGLSTTAENEGAATALHHAPIDLRPEGDKVVDRRHQRETYHEPDRDLRDHLDREEILAVHRPFGPAVVEDYGHHRYDLHHHLELAQLT